MRKILIALLLTIGISFAEVPYQECFLRAAMQYDIPYQILVAIAKVESGYDHETNEEDAKIMFESQDKIFNKLTCEL